MHAEASSAHKFQSLVAASGCCVQAAFPFQSECIKASPSTSIAGSESSLKGFIGIEEISEMDLDLWP